MNATIPDPLGDAEVAAAAQSRRRAEALLDSLTDAQLTMDVALFLCSPSWAPWQPIDKVVGASVQVGCAALASFPFRGLHTRVPDEAGR